MLLVLAGTRPLAPVRPLQARYVPPPPALLTARLARSPRRSRCYQRGPRRPPPPPPPPRLPPKPPPPPPNPPSGLGRASLTVSARPPIWNWLSSVAAFCASSSVDISTNAKPRARPVAASRITRTDSTLPALLNSSCSSASPVVYGRFPTYSLRPILTPHSQGGWHVGSAKAWRRERVRLRLDRLSAR